MPMDRQDAVRTLAAAGKTNQMLDLINTQAQAAVAEYDQIRADGTRTAEWIRWALAQAAQTWTTRVTNQLIDQASKVTTDDRSDRARVFGIAGLPGDVATLTILMRDAADRVNEIATTRPEDLYDKLVQATNSGDEVLARQIAQWATENQSVRLMQQFLDDRPQLEAAGERLWNASRAASDTMGVTWALGALIPSEVGSSFYQVEVVAAEPEPGTPAANAPFRLPSAVTGTRSIFEALAADERY